MSDQTLRFRCPRCSERVDFVVTRARLDRDLYETTTLGEGPADPSYVEGPLTADIEARSTHTC